jgi:hypothetical protein
VRKGTPTVDARKPFSGWDDEDAPSRGWRIDHIQGADTPYVSQTNINIGKNGNPTVFWDAPSFFCDTPVRNLGKEFVTVAIGWNHGQIPVYLGSVRWGYYVDRAGRVSFRPEVPEWQNSPPKEVGDALHRWNQLWVNNSTGTIAQLKNGEFIVDKIKHLPMDPIRPRPR